MLKLRRGTVVATDPLLVEVDGERRRAWSDQGLIGPIEGGDELIVNTAALDLGLGSGGFDIVHVNLTRGLEGGAAAPGMHVIKLNYSSIQHPIEPIEAPTDAPARPGRPIPVLVVSLHGHLAPAVWAAAECARGARIGYVQTGGGGLPGSLSRDVAELRRRELLAGHVTVAPAYGGEDEAISLIGALHAAAEQLGWDAAIVAPGPGILGSETRYGHGGMAAIESVHAALALGLPTILGPRLSDSDPRPRHQGLSHHTRAVLELALGPLRVGVPEDLDAISSPRGVEAGSALTGACGSRHAIVAMPADLAAYAESGLPTRTMGRDLYEDRLFFAAPLAAGAVLGAASLPG